MDIFSKPPTLACQGMLWGLRQERSSSLTLAPKPSEWACPARPVTFLLGRLWSRVGDPPPHQNLEATLFPSGEIRTFLLKLLVYDSGSVIPAQPGQTFLHVNKSPPFSTGRKGCGWTGPWCLCLPRKGREKGHHLHLPH